MKLIFWWIVWKVALKLYLWPVLALRCDGKQPALSWIPPSAPGAGDGYYRGGIQAQYCQLPRGHAHPLCLAPIDSYGDRKVGGARFIPEPVEEVEV